MKFLGGISQDTNLVDQNQESPFYGKNGVTLAKIGSINNEEGFKFSAINDKINLAVASKIPLGFSPIGTIGMERVCIIFSTNNIDSEIGIYNEDTDTYTTTINSRELNFSSDYPIEGTWTANFRGDVIISWTDNYNPPRVMNINSIPNPFNTNKIDIFKDSKVPYGTNATALTYSVQTGGNFTGAGAFYPYIKYRNYGGDETSWLAIENIIFIDGSFQSITMTFDNIDTTYDLFVIGFYYILNDVIYEREFRQIPISVLANTITTTITGFESFIELIQGTLLLPALNYKKARTLTELSKQLVLANLTEVSNFQYQKYACNIKLKWYSEIVQDTAFSSKYEDKGFCHDEIYSFYIRFRLLNGNLSQAFHIPGPATSDFVLGNISAVDNANGDVCKAYQLRDFSTITDTTNNNNCKGAFSYWENKNEIYPIEGKVNPNQEEFNGSFEYDGVTPIVGGRNLITEIGVNGLGRVKHFKFPNLQTTWDYYRSKGHAEYGLNALDRLGINVDTSSIYIPNDIKAKIQGYEIFYADRNLSNQTIIAQDMFLYGASYNGDSPTTGFKTSTGCNFGSVIKDSSTNQHMEIQYDIVRNHSFDLLANNNGGDAHAFPTIYPTHIKLNFDIRSTFPYGVGQIGKYSGDGFLVVTNSRGGTSTEKYTGGNYIKKIKSSRYLTNNSIAGVGTLALDNRLQESCYVMQLNDYVDHINNITDYLDIVPFTNILLLNGGAIAHKSANYNLFTLKSDIYEKFTEQNLISTGRIFTDQTTEITIFGGDIFLSKCCSNNYGIYYWDQIGDEPDNGVRGIKAYHYYIAETKNNGNKRIQTDNYSAFYTPLTSNLPTLETNALADGINAIADYKYSYNYEFSSNLNRLVSSIFNPNQLFSNRFPNRIIRSIPSGNDTKILAWMFFLVADYDDIRRNRGEIINIEQFQENRLLIHTIQALFITVNRTTLNTESINVTLGTGDIFDQEPVEVLFDDKGVLGLQHRHAAIITPLGYFFPDAARKKIFIFQGENNIKEISAFGLRNFFLDSLVDIPNDLNSLGISKIISAYDVLNNRIIMSVKNGEKQYTLSYSSDLNNGNGGWAFWHDYIPDLIFNTRYKLLSFKRDVTNEDNLYIHNEGSKKGVYYKEDLNLDIIKPFFIDIVFNAYIETEKGRSRSRANALFQSILFKTEVKRTISKFLETFTHITIRNEYQCSGKISLIFSPDLGEGNIRKTEDYWSFNDFRDLVIHDPNNPNDYTTFIENVYKDFNVILSSLDLSKDEFDQKHFVHPYMIVRFEYDNLNNSEISLIDVDVKINQSLR